MTRLSKGVRKGVFKEISACRTDTNRKADQLHPPLDPREPDYTVKKDMQAFRDHSRYQDAGDLRCARQIAGKHELSPPEFRSITTEGLCKQWPPLTGKPAC